MSVPQPSSKLPGIILFLFSVTWAGALTPLSDTFTGTSINAAKWQTPVLAGGGSLSQSGNLRYTSSVAAGDSSAYLPSATLPLYTESWEVVVDVVNSTTPTVVDQVASTGIEIFNTANLNDSVFMELYASALTTLPMRRGFLATLVHNGTDAFVQDTLNIPGQTSGSLRVQFSASTKVITAYYDSTGSADGFQWTQIASYGIGGSGGANGNVNWGLSAGSPLAVTIYGFSSGMTVTAGQLTMDNFSTTASTYTVTSVTVGKSISYLQTSATSVALSPAPATSDYGGPFGFSVNVDGLNISALSTAPVVTGPFSAFHLNTAPTTHNQGILLYSNDDGMWRYGSPNANDWGSPTLSDLDARFGSGTYTVTLGAISVPLTLTGDIYPNIPSFTLSGGVWSGGKYYIDPAVALTLTTNTFTTYGSHVEDSIESGIYGITDNQVFASSSPGTKSLSYQVAANTLTLGLEYDGYASFIAASSLNSAALAGSQNAAYYELGTEFTLVAMTVQQSWRQTHFGITTNSGDAADSLDYDHDGLSNLLEWACNLNPTTASNLPASGIRNGVNFEYTYTRSVGAVDAGATFTVEWSDTLAANSWSPANVTETILSDDGTVQQIKATLPAGSTGHRFVHLKVSAPP